MPSVAHSRAAPARRSRGSRRGFTLVELATSVLLLGSVMLMAIPLIQFVLAERVQTDLQQFVLWELENSLEVLAAQPAEKLTAESVAATPVPEAIKARLPEVQWKLQLTEIAAAEGAPAARRLNGEVRWKDRRGQWLAPVRLTTWIHAGEAR